MNDKLTPCPFCGNTKLKLEKKSYGKSKKGYK